MPILVLPAFKCDCPEVNVAENYSYDPLGRLVQETYCTPQDCNYDHVVQAQYEPGGGMVSLTFPDGEALTQQFATSGLLSAVNYSGQNYLTVNSYDSAGHVTSASMGSSAAAMTAFYNNREEIGSLAYTAGSSTRWSKAYTWQANGSLQDVEDLVNNTTRQFGYDPLNRVTSAEDVTTGTQNPAPNGLEHFPFYCRPTLQSLNQA